MPPGPSILQQAGAKPSRESQGAPLFHNRFFTGLWTQRNVLRDPSGVVTERWYGGRSDALLDGLNVELTNRLTLARAPGSSVFSAATFPGAVNSFYAFKQFATNSETITLMADDATNIYTFNPTAKTSILTKAAGSGRATFLGVGNVLYMGDGAEQKAYTLAGGTRNWGITRAASVAISGDYAGLAVNNPIGGWAWVNPANAQGPPDGSYATSAVGSGGGSDYLDLTTFNLTLSPAAPMVGIEVDVTKLLDSGGVNRFYQIDAQLLLNGAPIGNLKSLTAGHFSLGTPLVFGGPNDMWGTSLSASQVGANSTAFGVRIQAFFTNSPPTSHTYSIDAVLMIGTQAGPCAVNLVAGGFSPAPATGYKYVMMWGNSGVVYGQANIPSALIKPDGTHSVQVSLTASTDPQVNQIWLLRTADGGATYYNLPSSPYPNATGVVVDSAPDSQLNLFQQADMNGLNTPPPSGAIAPEFHMGRTWVAAGNVLAYSVGSDGGLILTGPNEGFPPANFFTFPSAITRMVSISSVDFSMLLVFTLSDVYAVYGNGSAAAASTGVAGITAFFAAPLLRRVGLSSYWALDIRGSQIYMMAADGRVITFNPSSQVIFTDPEKAINEIGFPIGAAPTGVTMIGGTLATFNPANAYVTWHGAGSADQALYVADGSTGWFRCNTNQQPDGGIVWSTKRILFSSAVQSIETLPGVFQLLIGPSSGGGRPAYRDLTVFSDQGSAYGNCYARFGAIVLAQPGQIANPEFVTCDFNAVGSQPTVFVLFDELDATFIQLNKTTNDPPHLVAPASLFANRYSIRQATSGTQKPAAGRFMQLIVDFGNADTVQNELLSLTVFGAYDEEA